MGFGIVPMAGFLVSMAGLTAFGCGRAAPEKISKTHFDVGLGERYWMSFSRKDGMQKLIGCCTDEAPTGTIELLNTILPEEASNGDRIPQIPTEGNELNV